MYVAFTSPGMLQRLPKARGKKLKLVVDGKQNVVANNYTIVTLAFVVCRQQTSWTTLSPGRGRRHRLEMHTATSQPFMQCLVQSEAHDNMTRAFRDAIDVCALHGDVDLKTQLIQVHKDYALGLESARAEIFPACRCISDYFHMRQNVRQGLSSKMPAPCVTEGEGGEPAPKRPRGKAKAKQQRCDGVARLLRLLEDTRMLPTVELFDAIWRVILLGMEKSGHSAAAAYLQNTYMLKVPVHVLRRPVAVDRFRGPTFASVCALFASREANVAGSSSRLLGIRQEQHC